MAIMHVANCHDNTFLCLRDGWLTCCRERCIGVVCVFSQRVSKEVGCKLVGIGGGDICNSNRKLILAIVWQLMRAYTIKLLTELGGGTKKIEDKQIVKWVRLFCLVVLVAVEEVLCIWYVLE